jgi:hypothetical protein
MVVVQDRAAFAAEYPWVPASAIADRVYSGNHDNAGETITLLDAGGGVLQRFTYDDVWYNSTDGDGYSLVVADTFSAKSAWGTAQGWQPSREIGGSPAEVDLLRGDFNGDARVDVFDLAILQANLGLASGATHAQGDMNRDGAVQSEDAALFSANLGDTYSPPTVPSPSASADAVVARRLLRGAALESAAMARRTAVSSGGPAEGRAVAATAQSVLRARRTPRLPIAESARDAAIAGLFGE